jgi:phage terminase small subunit
LSFFDYEMKGGGHIGLSERQKRFADEYLISGVAQQAAVKAGYSEKYAKKRGHELLANVGIQSYIDERMKELEKKKIAKQDEVMQVFTSILRQELTEEVVELNAATGQFVKTKKPPSISEVIKAGSELMKRYPTDKQAEKMQLEIDKLKSQIGGDEGQDEKIAGFLNLIKGAVSDGLE